MEVPTLRTPETEGRYQKMKDEGFLNQGCALCAEDVKMTFTYWKLIANRFPYDKIAKKHDMLIPIRHAAEIDEEERAELLEIRNGYINENYRYVLEATNRTRSIPAHYHLHLIEIK